MFFHVFVCYPGGMVSHPRSLPGLWSQDLSRGSTGLTGLIHILSGGGGGPQFQNRIERGRGGIVFDLTALYIIVICNEINVSLCWQFLTTVIFVILGIDKRFAALPSELIGQ